MFVFLQTLMSGGGVYVQSLSLSVIHTQIVSPSVCLRKAAQISCFANIATCEMCEKYTYIRNVTHLFLVFFPFSAVTPNRSVFLLIRGFVLLCTSPRREKRYKCFCCCFYAKMQCKKYLNTIQKKRRCRRPRGRLRCVSGLIALKIVSCYKKLTSVYCTFELCCYSVVGFRLKWSYVLLREVLFCGYADVVVVVVYAVDGKQKRNVKFI